MSGIPNLTLREKRRGERFERSLTSSNASYNNSNSFNVSLQQPPPFKSDLEKAKVKTLLATKTSYPSIISSGKPPLLLPKSNYTYSTASSHIPTHPITSIPVNRNVKSVPSFKSSALNSSINNPLARKLANNYSASTLKSADSNISTENSTKTFLPKPPPLETKTAVRSPRKSILSNGNSEIILQPINTMEVSNVKAKPQHSRAKDDRKKNLHPELHALLRLTIDKPYLVCHNLFHNNFYCRRDCRETYPDHCRHSKTSGIR